MLRLSRHVGEGVVIDNRIVLRILAIENARRVRFELRASRASNAETAAFSLDLKDRRFIMPDLVELQLQDVERGQVRLGFNAPRAIVIEREELL